MRVLVTGAAGFLGRYFTWYHLEAGDDVVGVDNLQNPSSFWPLGTYEKWRDDVRGFLRYPKADRGYDIIYHFAAPVGGRTKIDNDPLYNAESLEIDTAIIRWATGLKNDPLFVYPSSSAVYGKVYQGHVADGFGNWALAENLFEVDSTTWAVPDEAYGFVKMSGELVLDKARKYGLRSLILRPFSGYGEGQSHEYPFPTIMQKIARRDEEIIIWGTGYQIRDFIHVEDIVRGTQALIKGGHTGAWNLGTGIGTDFLTLADMAAKMEGYSPAIATDPTKPTGVFRRIANTERLDKVYKPQVPLNVGIARMLTYERSRL